MKFTQLCPTLCEPMEPTRLLCPWNSPGKNTGVDCYSLIQGIFLNPGIKPGSPILQADSLPSELPDSVRPPNKTQTHTSHLVCFYFSQHSWSPGCFWPFSYFAFSPISAIVGGFPLYNNLYDAHDQVHTESNTK